MSQECCINTVCVGLNMGSFCGAAFVVILAVSTKLCRRGVWLANRSNLSLSLGCCVALCLTFSSRYQTFTDCTAAIIRFNCDGFSKLLLQVFCIVKLLTRN